MRGLENVLAADAPVLPRMVSGDTHAPAVMIAGLVLALFPAGVRGRSGTGNGRFETERLLAAHA